MKHLLSAKDLTRDKAVMALDTVEVMAATQRHAVKKLPTLRGKTVVNFLFEDSIRTRLPFEAAAKHLSAGVINFLVKGSSVSKGESLKDTVQTIMAMGTDVVAVRHSAYGAAHLPAHAGWINVPALDAGDDTHQHPTQTLLDVMTLRCWYIPGAPVIADDSPCSQGWDLEGARLIIVRNVLHFRVARSNVDLMMTLGAKATFAVPPIPLPVGMDDWFCEVPYNLNEVIEETQPDAVMMLRIQRERMSVVGGGFFPSPAEYSNVHGLTSARHRVMPEHAVTMHPGLMNRGLGTTAEVANDPRSRIIEQVGNGVSVRMAVLYLLLADGGNQL